MDGVTLQKLVELLLLNALRLKLLVSGRHVAGNGLSLSARFCTFDNYGFPWHGLICLK